MQVLFADALHRQALESDEQRVWSLFVAAVLTLGVAEVLTLGIALWLVVGTICCMPSGLRKTKNLAGGALGRKGPRQRAMNNYGISAQSQLSKTWKEAPNSWQ